MAPRSRSVFHVEDPRSNRAFGLLDTEVSVARMLDGKRKVQDVLENAAKLGIEVTLDSLQHFISHLKGYRFIDQDIREGSTTWPAREAWTEEERRLYQSSMKKLREGQFAEALSLASSLEASDPTSEEARLLKHRVEVEAEGIFELVGTFGELHGSPRAKPVSAPEVAPVQPVAIARAAAPVPGAPGRGLLKFVREHRRAVGTGVVLLGLLVLLRPVPARTVVVCELQVETLGLPRTMRGGKVGAHDVAPGTRVEKGAVVARLGTGQSVDGLESRVKELEATLRALPAATTGKKTELARASVRKLQAAVTTLERSRKAGSKAQQQAAQTKLQGKQRELDAAKKALDALTHEATRASLETELKTLREKKAVLDAVLSGSIIVAPVAGLFVAVGALPEELAVNDTFGQIVGPSFKLVTKDALPARIETATFRAGQVEAELSVVDGRPVFPVRAAFVGARGTLEVTSGYTPWLASLLR